jgi:signal transduction histidine kinase/DNA-binding NarL/FixJ family response regulator
MFVEPTLLIGISSGVIAGIGVAALFSGSKNKQIKKLQVQVEDEKEKIDSLNVKIAELEKKLFQQAGASRSKSFISEQIKKIEELESELSKYKKRVEDTKKIAQSAHRVKYDFLANIRHEIRTPLNSILVFSELLRDEIKDHTQLTYATNISQSGHKLLNLMDKIIELSNLESDKFEMHEKALDTQLFFKDVVEEHYEKAYKKFLKLSLDLDENLPKALFLDEEKIKEILSNLIDNAIKFTQEGYIKVDVKVDDANIINNTINISILVEDSGMGIDPKYHDTIFEIFEKRENSNELEFQGTGLGLSINKKMAKKMGGDLLVESELKHGSTFTLKLHNVEIALSNSKDEDIDESDIDFNIIKSSNIMIVDEDMQNSNTLIESFNQTEVEVYSYSDPRDAIESLKKNQIDLMFMDINILSSDDGAVSKVMAKMTNAPVVSLTDGSMKHIALVTNGMKIVGHLKKPISKLALFKICLQLLNSQHLLNNRDQKLDNGSQLFVDIVADQYSLFTKDIEEKVTPLYEKFQLTNDLNVSVEFAKNLVSVSQKYKIQEFVSLGEKLLSRVELFDIETIEKLMTQYMEYIHILKSKFSQ